MFATPLQLWLERLLVLLSILHDGSLNDVDDNSIEFLVLRLTLTLRCQMMTCKPVMERSDDSGHRNDVQGSSQSLHLRASRPKSYVFTQYQQSPHLRASDSLNPIENKFPSSFSTRYRRRHPSANVGNNVHLSGNSRVHTSTPSCRRRRRIEPRCRNHPASPFHPNTIYAYRPHVAQ